MAKTAAMAAQDLRPKTGIQLFWVRFKKCWQLHLMMLLPVAYVFLFHYVPIYGIQISFKEYSPRKGIMGSAWVGLEHLKRFFGYYKWVDLVWNTLALSLYSIGVGFPIPIIFALIMHVNTQKGLKKFAQNITVMPHYISLVILIGMINTILNPMTGVIGYFSRLFGIAVTEDIRGSEGAFRHLYIWSGIWQGMGWSSIMYVSALSGVPDELHEAAKLDGATRLRRVWSVDIPTILPTVALMLIMRFGGILSVGYQKAWLMQNSQNIDVSEIISTYVYKQGIQKSEMSFGACVGLLQTAINLTLLCTVNWITNVLTDNEMGMF